MPTQQIREEALVLDSRPYRDRDLLVSLLTAGHGQVRGVFRGARGGRNPKSAAAQVFSHVRLAAFQGAHAELATVRSIDLIRSSFPLAESLETSSAATVAAETLLLFCPPGEPAPRRFRLGVAVLEALLGGASPDGLITYTQLWILRLGGLLPGLDHCPTCGKLLENRARWKPPETDLHCTKCLSSGLLLERSDLETLRRYISTPPAEVAETPPGAVAGALDAWIRDAGGARMRALDFHRSQISPNGRTGGRSAP